LESRLREIELAVKAGATEIDIVVERHLVITQNWTRTKKKRMLDLSKIIYAMKF
jgi:deoxyribose-phosphate aldolase